jgi:hypothetical protein
MRIPNPPDMKVRLSADLRQKIEISARDNNRTMNAEIGARLEQSFRKEGRAVSLVSSPNLEERLDNIERQLVDRLLDVTALSDRLSALEKRVKQST